MFGPSFSDYERLQSGMREIINYQLTLGSFMLDAEMFTTEEFDKRLLSMTAAIDQRIAEEREKKIAEMTPEERNTAELLAKFGGIFQ